MGITEVQEFRVARIRKWLKDERNSEWEDKRLKNLIPDLVRELEPGWMHQYLLDYDVWLRWWYWNHVFISVQDRNALPPEPIPQIDFDSGSRNAEGFGGDTMRHLERCLDLIPNYGRGGYKSWDSSRYFEYFLDWLLFAFGYQGQKELPQEPHGCEGACMRLYQFFNLGKLVAYPYDYFGGLFSEMGVGRAAAFFPTPHHIVDLMSQMTHKMHKHDRDSQGRWFDGRLEACYDCAVGTGRTLLYGSNHHLLLYGQDINLIMVKACLVNLAMYAPWGFYPIPGLERPGREQLEAQFDQPVEELKESWKFAPVGKRGKKKSVMQGLLFEE